ncbi:GNAT family N-acetyltransferase [Kitasatospora sp. NPDC048365]|uniref:GNAT family N-acetyltransferase n=1 Tax=Kitasatospora sp. NPDC048365 TaxID=3364050 RepID=UPI0037168551
MYEMRAATAADSTAVAEVVCERSAWLSERGLGECADLADFFAAQAADPGQPVWVLEHRTEGVVGFTTVLGTDGLPDWGFTETERAESSLFLVTTFTRPNPHRLGRLIAWWALDRAARDGVQWVRRGTGQEQLSRYYQVAQGWDLLRVADLRGDKVFMLQRRATRMPGLPELMTGRGL